MQDYVMLPVVRFDCACRSTAFGRKRIRGAATSLLMHVEIPLLLGTGTSHSQDTHM